MEVGGQVMGAANKGVYFDDAEGVLFFFFLPGSCIPICKFPMRLQVGISSPRQ